MQYRYGDRHASPAVKLARRLWLERYLDLAGLPPRPDSVDHSDVGMPSGMLGNDTVGNCVEAAAGHAIEVQTADFSFNRGAGKIRGLAAQAGERVEQGGFAGVRIADQRERERAMLRERGGQPCRSF